MASPRPIIKRTPAAQGTWADKMKEAKARPYKGTKGGLPEKTSNYGRGNLNRASTPDKINLGQSGRSSSRAMSTTPKPKTVPLGERPKLLSGPSAGKAASAASKAASRFLGVGSVFVGMVADATPAGSPQERSWERRNTEQRRMKGKASGMGFTCSGKLNPDVPKRRASGTYTAPYDKKPIMPSVSMANGGVNRPTPKAGNQIGMAATNKAAKEKVAASKTKTGAAATSVATTPAVKKRKSFFERRQAERYAIGSSGKSL